MRTLLAALIIVPSVFAVGPAFAQANPSVDQIIKSLTPTGDVSRSATRGIRLAPAATAEPRAATPPVNQVAATVAKPAGSDTAASSAQPTAPTVNLTVNFATGSAELTPQAVKTLNDLGTALSSDSLANYRFRVEGHTDTVGSREFNRALSERRAEVVVSYISAKFHVAGTRLQPVGMGAERPLVATADQIAEARNRRVQVVNIGS